MAGNAIAQMPIEEDCGVAARNVGNDPARGTSSGTAKQKSAQKEERSKTLIRPRSQ